MLLASWLDPSFTHPALALLIAIVSRFVTEVLPTLSRLKPPFTGHCLATMKEREARQSVLLTVQLGCAADKIQAKFTGLPPSPSLSMGSIYALRITLHYLT